MRISTTNSPFGTDDMRCFCSWFQYLILLLLMMRPLHLSWSMPSMMHLHWQYSPYFPCFLCSPFLFPYSPSSYRHEIARLKSDEYWLCAPCVRCMVNRSLKQKPNISQIRLNSIEHLVSLNFRSLVD